jgi:crossover junction endonuclease MUS81
MKIAIDYRETKLVELCKSYIEKMNFKNNEIELVTENLALGDIIISNDDKEIIIIERKSLNDLASSIKDGRYKEQSFRLNNYNIHNHNIIYLIEGDWNDYNRGKFNKSINQHTLTSSIISINYYKGFSIYRTQTISETASYIVYFADKLMRENTKKIGYYSNVIDDASTILNDNVDRNLNKPIDSYSHAIKKVKKDNITIDNIGEIILSQIPNVSSQSAVSIMNKFKTIKNLISQLEKDDTCLNNIFTGTDKPRKLNKNCKLSIYKFLLQKEIELIID